MQSARFFIINNSNRSVTDIEQMHKDFYQQRTMYCEHSSRYYLSGAAALKLAV